MSQQLEFLVAAVETVGDHHRIMGSIMYIKGLMDAEVAAAEELVLPMQTK